MTTSLLIPAANPDIIVDGPNTVPVPVRSPTSAGAAVMPPFNVAETPSIVMVSLIEPDAESVSSNTTMNPTTEAEESALVIVPKVESRLFSKIDSCRNPEQTPLLIIVNPEGFTFAFEIDPDHLM